MVEMMVIKRNKGRAQAREQQRHDGQSGRSTQEAAQSGTQRDKYTKDKEKTEQRETRMTPI